MNKNKTNYPVQSTKESKIFYEQPPKSHNFGSFQKQNIKHQVSTTVPLTQVNQQPYPPKSELPSTFNSMVKATNIEISPGNSPFLTGPTMNQTGYQPVNTKTEFSMSNKMMKDLEEKSRLLRAECETFKSEQKQLETIIQRPDESIQIE